MQNLSVLQQHLCTKRVCEMSRSKSQHEVARVYVKGICGLITLPGPKFVLNISSHVFCLSFPRSVTPCIGFGAFDRSRVTFGGFLRRRVSEDQTRAGGHDGRAGRRGPALCEANGRCNFWRGSCRFVFLLLFFFYFSFGGVLANGMGQK